MEVLPDCDAQCTQDRVDAKDKPKNTGRVYDRVFIRHWDTWSDGTRSHLFVATVGATARPARPSTCRRRSMRMCPPSPSAATRNTPSARTAASIVFTARVAGTYGAVVDQLRSLRSARGRLGRADRISRREISRGTRSPCFSKNGDLAYLAMDRPGFEADRFHVMLRDARTGTTRALTQVLGSLCRRASASAADGKRLLATVDDVGQQALYAIDVANGTPRKIVATGQVTDYSAAKDSRGLRAREPRRSGRPVSSRASAAARRSASLP